MSQYYSLVTQAGLAAEASAKGLGQSVNLTEFAVGDSNGTEYDPIGPETALKNEVYRGAISNITVDPNNANQFIVDCVVPQDQGGFTIREAAVFTDNGVMYGIAKHPPSFKAIAGSATASELRVKFVFATSSASSINLVINPSQVNASREFVEDSFEFIEVTANRDAQKGKLHIFTDHADLTLGDESNGVMVSAQVDDSVDLKTGECRVKAPAGEKIVINGKQADIARFTEVNTSYRFKRINGVWKV